MLVAQYFCKLMNKKIILLKIDNVDVVFLTFMLGAYRVIGSHMAAGGGDEH